MIDAAILLLVFYSHWQMLGAVFAWSGRFPRLLRLAVPGLAAGADAALLLAFLLPLFNRFDILRAGSRLPAGWWIAGGVWVMSSTAGWVVFKLWYRLFPRRASFSPGRRALIHTAGTVLASAPLAAIGYGTFIERTRFRVRETDLPVSNLPAGLEGLSMVQLTDIHLSPFLSERDLARVIDAANELRARVGLITGDLISTAGDPVDACLRQLARLKVDSELLGCMGNHEIYAGSVRYTEEQGARLGMHFLRQRSRQLRFGQSVLNVTGYDYQRFSERRRYLEGAENLVAPGSVNLLLSHNPDVFPVAVRKGYDVVVSGHTHGGQINVEILHRNMNVARFYTPFVYGKYLLEREGSQCSAYVCRGIGTIGLPTRLGAPPEIALLRLVKA